MITRRHFLKNAVLTAGAALAGTGVVQGCRRVQSDGRIRLRYWEKWGGSEAPAMKQVVNAFNASQDRVVVDYLSVSQIDRKTIVSIAGGDPPDIAGLWASNLPVFADQQALVPLDDFLRRDGITPAQWSARYIPAIASQFEYQGRIYGVPSTPSASALHWNKALFRQAGLDPEQPPRTLAELDAMARELVRRDRKTGHLTQVGFLPLQPSWWAWAYPAWFGGRLLDDAGAVCVGRDERNLEALRWVRQFTEDYGLEATMRFTSGLGGTMTSFSAFFSGKIAMMVQGVWMDHHANLYAPDLDYGVAPWPHVPGTNPAPFTTVDADALVLCRGCRHPEAAWEFVRFASSVNPRALTRDELGPIEMLCFLQEKNSPLREWSPYFTTHHPHRYIRQFRELAVSPGAIHFPMLGVWHEYRGEIENAFSTVSSLKRTPEEALAAVQRRMERSWNRYRRSLERQRRAALG